MFPMPRIRRELWIARHSRVEGDYGSDPHWAVTADGAVWVHKRRDDLLQNGMIAEALAWMLGRELSAPIPDAAVVVVDHPEVGWLSRQVKCVTNWNPDCVDLVENLDQIGSVIALEAVLCETDRHNGNFLLEVTGSASLRLWAVDFALARIRVPDQLLANLDALPHIFAQGHPKVHLVGLPIDRVAKTALECAEVLRSVSPSAIREMVNEACAVSGATELRAPLEECLSQRLRRGVILTEGHLRQLEAAP